MKFFSVKASLPQIVIAFGPIIQHLVRKYPQFMIGRDNVLISYQIDPQTEMNYRESVVSTWILCSAYGRKHNYHVAFVKMGCWSLISAVHQSLRSSA